MVGSALDGEHVALRPTRVDGLLDVYYCQLRLARCRPLDPTVAGGPDAG